MSRYLPVPSKVSPVFWVACIPVPMQIPLVTGLLAPTATPLYICPECASRKLTWTRVSGKGTIYTYTIAQKSVFEDVVGPMVVALIELEEGAMMTSNIVVADPNTLAIGMPVRLRYEKISDDITLPVFEPAP